MEAPSTIEPAMSSASAAQTTTTSPSSSSSSSSSPASPASSTSATDIRQNIGPLTTEFTPDWRCSVCSFEGTDNKPNYSTEYFELCTAFRKERLCPSVEPPACFPHVTAVSDISIGTFFYSPGLHCPQGWKTVATVTAGQTDVSSPAAPSISGVGLATLLPGETAAVCCPSSLSYVRLTGQGPLGNFYHCTANVTTTSSYMYCENRTGTRVLDKSYTGVGSDIAYTYLQHGPHVTTLPFRSVRVEAAKIQLNWRSQDRQSPSNSTTAGGVRGTDPTGIVPQTGAPTTSDGAGGAAAATGPSSLSGASVAGIAVGASCFVIGVGLLVLALWFRRRRRRKAAADGSGEKPPLTPGLGEGGFQKAELANTAATGRDRFHKPELEAPNHFEMDANPATFELYGDEEFIPGELPAADDDNDNNRNNTNTNSSMYESAERRSRKGGGVHERGAGVAPAAGPSPPTPLPLPRAGGTSGDSGRVNARATDTDHPMNAARPTTTLAHVPQRKAIPGRGTALRAHPPPSHSPSPSPPRSHHHQPQAPAQAQAVPSRRRGGSRRPVPRATGPDRGSIEGGWI
ncbi:CFEM domain-containing protein [Purpureocillium lavendulum]|uniref:CFEM domain-containing protein n=1 Tax=Purpureocillium lavendulum TaxID=1247861 RepID=A0AB34FQ38_9HYPO|nr:CFEM domain-containing protein [Purpureocillium lavendulum]